MICDTVTDPGGATCLFDANSNTGESRNDSQPWTIRPHRPLRTRGTFGRSGGDGHDWHLGLSGPHFRWYGLCQLLPHIPHTWPKDLPRLLVRRLLWILGFVAAAVVAFVLASAAAFAETPVLSAPEAAAKLASGDLIVLDIRRPEEWAETGVAEGAWPVSMHNPDFPKQLQAILAQHLPEKIGLICATGGRSAYVTEVLARNGLDGVVDVSEGMFGNGQLAGWIARGLPVVSLDQAIAEYETTMETWE